jgi:hypothetical protein
MINAIILKGTGIITEMDVLIAVMGYIIVFLALLLLYFVFSSIPRILSWRKNYLMKKQGKECKDECNGIPGDVLAAISIALYLHANEYHDEESHSITIKKVSRNYSPWSSKIYGLSEISSIKSN